MITLITGSSGFLGQKILRYNIGTIYTLNRKLGHYKVDLSLFVPEFNHNFDLVIHNAGRAHCPPSTYNKRDLFYETNVIGTINLLKGLQNYVPKYFVYISSVAVYGLNSGLNIDENTPLNSTDQYGLSKVQAEQLIMDWCFKHNVTFTILRLPLVVGKFPPGNLADIINSIKSGYYFNIGGGKAFKSMVLAQDVARFLPTVYPIGGIFNLTDGKNPSIFELTVSIAKKKLFNLPFVIALVIAKFGDLFNFIPLNSIKLKKLTTSLTFDDSKARKIGWSPNSVIEYVRNTDFFK